MARRATRQVNVRLPIDLIEELNLVVTVLDTSQADLISEALRQYLTRLSPRVRRAVTVLLQARRATR